MSFVSPIAGASESLVAKQLGRCARNCHTGSDSDRIHPRTLQVVRGRRCIARGGGLLPPHTSRRGMGIAKRKAKDRMRDRELEKSKKDGRGDILPRYTQARIPVND